jgi:NAD+ diphosphatase
MQPRNIFAGPYLDRASHLREDPGWFAQALADERSRAVPVWNSQNLIRQGETPRAAFLSLGDVPAAQRTASDLILLGRLDGVHYFSYTIDAAAAPQLSPDARFEELRLVAASLPETDAGILSYARALAFWRDRNRYCGVCGAPNVASRAGHVLICSNVATRHETFPRTDSAIIVLVSDGERALLGRQASWPAGRYSTIAGFVEPGESLEDAVIREVYEETGIEVDAAEYHSSQPWPFPSSLMLGFIAHAASREIRLHDKELEDARWFSRADVAAGAVRVPPNVSISFRLIEHWFNAGWNVPLRELHEATWATAR